jgi:CRISPR-associated protein Csd1
MGWLSELSAVYDRIMKNKKVYDKPLPLYHIKNNAPLVITLDGAGKFRAAKLLGDDERADWQTCMPCTEKSAARTRRPEAYPFCDKLEYVAGDYADYAEGRDLKVKYKEYLSLLERWASSEFSTEKIRSVYKYVKKGSLIRDILKKKSIPEMDAEEKIGAKENNVFVRWVVEIPGDKKPQTWKDPEIQRLWIEFYLKDCQNKEGFCYVSGKKTTKLRELHPQKIRHSGDGAKIISANDDVNYTFRGRFTNPDEACQIGVEISEKAHSALRWLIEKQGTTVGGGLTVVSWCAVSDFQPQLLKGSHEMWPEDEEEDEYFPLEKSAKSIKNRLRGYHAKILDDDKILIMGLDAATPGRMSVLLYREFTKSDFCAAQENWHEHIAWFYTYWKKGSKESAHIVSSPSPEAIAEAAYGKNISKEARTRTVQRLLTCIIDRSAIPPDIEQLCFGRALRLNTLETRTEQEKTLETACAVIRYNLYTRNKEDYKVGLEEDRTSRDYLYGRLLAVADWVESWALKKRGETRDTNAVRYIQRFSRYPYSTWRILYVDKLRPYFSQLGRKSDWYKKLIQDIESLFDYNDYVSDKVLAGEFLLGYHCQQKAFRDGLAKLKAGNEHQPANDDNEEEN